MLSTGAISAAILSFCVFVAHAQTSLWIPGIDPQAISAGILGVGSDGRTTWEIQQGTASGAFTDTEDFGFGATATLVEGPNDAVLSVAMTQGEPATVVYSCTINNGVAVCADTFSESSIVSTAFVTETVVPMPVQGGGPVSGSGAAPTSAPARGSPTQSAGGSQASVGSSPQPSGPSPTGTTGGSNGAGRHQIAGSLLGLGVIGSMIHCVL